MIRPSSLSKLDTIALLFGTTKRPFMKIKDSTLTRIGTDPRWLLSGLKLKKANVLRGQKAPQQSLLEEMLYQYLGIETGRSILPEASILAVTSRQVAIRRHLSYGVQSALSPEENFEAHRSVISRKIQRLLQIDGGHARRVANGLGILADDEGTDLLADLYVGGSKQLTRELDVDLIQMLACGTGEHLCSFVQEPFLFAANTACAAIRLRYQTPTGSDILVLKNEIKQRFPPIVQPPLVDARAAPGKLTPMMKVAAYGLALWQQAGNLLSEDLDNPEVFDCKLDYSRLVRQVAYQASWIFPELEQVSINPVLMSEIKNKEALIELQQRQRDRLLSAGRDTHYQTLLANSVEEVGLEVGKAMCGLAPYTRHVGELSDESR